MLPSEDVSAEAPIRGSLPGGRILILRPKPVGRDSVEPFQSLKFSVSSLKREPALKLES